MDKKMSVDEMFDKIVEIIYKAGYVKQVEAEWERLSYMHTSDYVIKCSACEASFERKSYQDPFPYCPNCGAKMSGGR